MYGAKESTKAPNGFGLTAPKTRVNQPNAAWAVPPNGAVNIPPVQYNGNAYKSNVTMNRSLNNKLVSVTNILSIVFTSIAMISIIIAMNVQDYERNDRESWNPTAIYIVLLLILGICHLAFLRHASNRCKGLISRPPLF